MQQARAAALSDHYDPRHRAVFLSEPVYAGRSVAATAVAAHETGHAIQHAQAYVPMKVALGAVAGRARSGRRRGSSCS